MALQSLPGVSSQCSISHRLFNHASPIEHESRTYASEDYVLPSDEKERQRLKLQHYVLKKAFENRALIAPIPSTGEIKILECGTGSGIWLLDVVKEVKGDLRGFDIESRLFPPNHPDNMSFSVASVTNMPEEWGQTFGLVHQRLLLAALNKNQWRDAINEMYRVLLPGGYIQLGEAGSWKSASVTAEHQTLVQTLFEARGLLLDCAVHIPKMLHDAGFTGIKTEVRSIPLGEWAGRAGIDGRDNFIGVFRGMKTPILKMGGLGLIKSETEFDSLLDAVEREWDLTPESQIDFYIFTAEKPISSSL